MQIAGDVDWILILFVCSHTFGLCLIVCSDYSLSSSHVISCIAGGFNGTDVVELPHDLLTGEGVASVLVYVSAQRA